MSSAQHPIFARLWHRVSRMDRPPVMDWRRELLAGLSGRVVEIGAGNGVNFALYPPTVTEIVAIEPEPYLRRMAEAAATTAPVPVRVMDADGERLPLGDGEFDAAVTCLVLCSVTDPAQALGEIHRVLAPDGQLRFLEHVRSPDHRADRVQHALDSSGLWPTLAGGCHCNRDTGTSIRTAGFQIDQVTSLTLPPAALPINPILLGTARRSSS